MRKSRGFFSFFFFLLLLFLFVFYIFKWTGNRRCEEYMKRERKEELCACVEERHHGGRASHARKCIMVGYW